MLLTVLITSSVVQKKQQQHMKQWENVTRSNVCVHQHHYHHRENSIQIYSHSSTNNRQKLYADCNGSMGMGEKVLYKGKTENCFLYFVFFLSVVVVLYFFILLFVSSLVFTQLCVPLTFATRMRTKDQQKK